MTNTIMLNAIVCLAINNNINVAQDSNTTIVAGKGYKQLGSMVHSQGSTLVKAPILDSIIAIADSTKYLSANKSDRVKLLGSINTGLKSAQALNDVSNLAKKLTNANNIGDVAKMADVTVGLSIGGQTQKENANRTENTTSSSSITGDSVQLIATGGDKSSISISGSDVLGKDSTTLQADSNVSITAAKETLDESTDNVSGGGSIGIGYNANTDFSLNLSANAGGGNGSTNSITHRNAQVGSKTGTTSITTGNKLSLKGANVDGKHINIKAKDLEIESLQDSYHHNNTQHNASASIGIGLSETGVSGGANYSFANTEINNKAVKKQSGISAGDDGLNINITNNTHLKGGVIQSTATTDENGNNKNIINTKTLTSENITNVSSLKKTNISAGFSTTVVGNALNAVGSLASALGNKNKSDESTTHSAIGGNIQINTQNSQKENNKTQNQENKNQENKNQETQAVKISRDVANANEKVTAYDLKKIKEQDEASYLVGEISKSAVNLSLTPKVEKAELEKEQAEKDLALNPEDSNAQERLNQANHTIDKYGKSGDIQMAVRAGTAFVQGIIAEDAGAAIVGLASPYANKLIKEQTKGNKATNLIAHTALGAIEAKITGNNPLSGASGALTGELTAQLVTEKLYKKSASELTEQEKETVSSFAKLGGGIASGLTGGNLNEMASGGNIAGRAVDNNYLTQEQVIDP